MHTYQLNRWMFRLCRLNMSRSLDQSQYHLIYSRCLVLRNALAFWQWSSQHQLHCPMCPFVHVKKCSNRDGGYMKCSHAHTGRASVDACLAKYASSGTCINEMAVIMQDPNAAIEPLYAKSETMSWGFTAELPRSECLTLLEHLKRFWRLGNKVLRF